MRASGRVLPRCLVLALCRFVQPAVALLELASEAPPDGEAQQSVRHGSTVTGLALRRKLVASKPKEVAVGKSQYEREESVDPARIETFAGLRQRFKRGEQSQTEESRLPDLFELTSRQGRPPASTHRPAATRLTSSGSEPRDQA